MAAINAKYAVKDLIYIILYKIMMDTISQPILYINDVDFWLASYQAIIKAMHMSRLRRMYEMKNDGILPCSGLSHSKSMSPAIACTNTDNANSRINNRVFFK